jgi:uncharacterized protein
MTPRLVLATNVVVSALLKPQGRENQLLRVALSGRFQLYTSAAVIAEYAKVLPYPKLKLDPQEIRSALEQLSKCSIVVHPSMIVDYIKHDEADNRFLECAEEAGADFLVTGNRNIFQRCGRPRGL